MLAKSSRDAAEATSSALQDGLKDKELCAHQKLLELQKRCDEQVRRSEFDPDPWVVSLCSWTEGQGHPRRQHGT